MWNFLYNINSHVIICCRQGYSLTIDSQYLEELGGFVNIEGVSSKNIYVSAPKMCYPDNKTFTSWAKSGQVVIEDLGTAPACGMLCS